MTLYTVWWKREGESTMCKPVKFVGPIACLYLVHTRRHFNTNMWDVSVWIMSSILCLTQSVLLFDLRCAATCSDVQRPAGRTEQDKSVARPLSWIANWELLLWGLTVKRARQILKTVTRFRVMSSLWQRIRVFDVSLPTELTEWLTEWLNFVRQDCRFRYERWPGQTVCSWRRYKLSVMRTWKHSWL